MTVSGASATTITATTSSAAKKTYGTVSGASTVCASVPAMIGPIPSPPRFAVVAMICARLGDECNSARYAVAVAVTIPTDRPLITRATISPGRSRQTRKSAALTRLSSSAGMSMRLRPNESERCPAKNSASVTPTA